MSQGWPTVQETADEYGQRRANETGHRYLRTALGHVWVDLGDNRKAAEDPNIGGIVREYRPERRRT